MCELRENEENTVVIIAMIKYLEYKSDAKCSPLAKRCPAST